MCATEFESAADYCEHLSNRRKNGAVRHLSGLKARGGAITRKPAGTNTRFDPNHIYVVAAHQDESAMEDMGDSSGSMHDDKTMGDKDAMMSAQTKINLKESTMSEEEINKIKADLDAALKKITDLEAASAEKDKAVVDLTAKFTEAEAGRVQLEASTRRAKLGVAITDEEWEKQKEALLALPQSMFDLMASKIAAPPKGAPPRVPVLTVSGGSDENATRLTLR